MKRYRLTESKLRNMIREAVKKSLREGKNDFEAAKYNGQWAIYDKGSRTYSCIGKGKKYCQQRARELNNGSEVKESRLKTLVRESVKSILREFDETGYTDNNLEALANYLQIDPEEIVEKDEHFYVVDNGEEWYVFKDRDEVEDYLFDSYKYDAPGFIESCYRDGQEFYEWLQKNPNSAAYFDMKKVFPSLQEPYIDEVYNEETGEYEEVEYDPRELDWTGFTDNVDWRYVAGVIFDADGPEWFLATYDGNEVELSNGALAYRHN